MTFVYHTAHVVRLDLNGCDLCISCYTIFVPRRDNCPHWPYATAGPIRHVMTHITTTRAPITTLRVCASSYCSWCHLHLEKFSRRTFQTFVRWLTIVPASLTVRCRAPATCREKKIPSTKFVHNVNRTKLSTLCNVWDEQDHTYATELFDDHLSLWTDTFAALSDSCTLFKGAMHSATSLRSRPDANSLLPKNV